MGRKRAPMSEGKKNIISMLIEEYDIITFSSGRKQNHLQF